ncbi:response regulator transcription factor [Streptomyces sp. NPDC050803]|uniref:response regulator transcription factor n=1 Tax=unclassified Streptomyces TaxID=2593676 RepID=UPI0034233E1E
MSATAGYRTGRARVIVVDEPALTEVLRVAVTEAGRRPCTALDGRSALNAARGRAPRAVVFDGTSPGLDGPGVPRRPHPMCHGNPRLTVLTLAAPDGVEAGADDCVTKPFSLEGAVPRLRRPQRRTGAEHGSGDDSGPRRPHSVHVLGDLVLTDPRQVLSRARILDHVWSSAFDGDGNLVEVCVSGLRRKLDRGRAPVIHTVRGLGCAIGAAEDGR